MSVRTIVEYINNNGSETELQLKRIKQIAEIVGASQADVRHIQKVCPKVRHGVYDLSAVVTPISNDVTVPASAPVRSTVELSVPDVDPDYVAWGHFGMIKKIIQSKQFFPTFITGMSGNGKTMMVEQACAKLKREFVRVQINPETDEDDLIGGYRLENGDTVFHKGPVIHAMERGAILLIDEIDRGSNKLMCLQGILEGKPFLLKKTGEVVAPAPGFNILATANTKGQGSLDGRFVAATILDDAFLERFTITVEQPFPSKAIETKIVQNAMTRFGADDTDFVDVLVKWADAIRATFVDGGVDDIVSTRRLCSIAQTYSILNDHKKSIQFCISRFQEETQSAFMDLFDMMTKNGDDGEKSPDSNDPFDNTSVGVDNNNG